MTQANQLEMTIGADILARALKHHTRSQGFNRWAARFVVVVTLVCCTLLVMKERPAEAALLGLFVLAFLSLLPPVQERFSRYFLGQQFKEMAVQNDISRVLCHYDESGITFAMGQATAHMAWSSYVKWREVDGLLMLYRNSRFFNVLDTAQIAPEQADDVRRYLALHNVNHEQ